MIKIIKMQPTIYYLNKFMPLLKLATSFKSYIFELQMKKYNFDNIPLFTEIGIETFNRCNLGCSFCPASRDTDVRTPQLMNPKLFSKIIDELKKINYNGKISLFINNEPLLDKRLEFFINEITTKLPNVYINIWTNGSLLTKERLNSLYNAGLRNLLIDNYNTKLQMLSEVDETLKSTKHEIIKKMNIKVWLRYKNVELTNRSGLVSNKINKVIQMNGCFYPFYFLNINPYGKAFICCNDTYNSNIVGDMNIQSLVQIWKGDILSKIRKQLIENGRKSLTPCRECNVIVLNKWGIR